MINICGKKKSLSVHASDIVVLPCHCEVFFLLQQLAYMPDGTFLKSFGFISKSQ